MVAKTGAKNKPDPSQDRRTWLVQSLSWIEAKRFDFV